jgi:serine/threonine-protein kinase HipA
MRVLKKPATLGVFLKTTGDLRTRVGALHRGAEGSTQFVVDQSYVALGAKRPVCSLAWRHAQFEEEGPTGSKARLQNVGDKIGNNGLLPPFFENLLPEGALLGLIQKEFGIGAFDNFDVLRRLGEDLPGAVWVEQEIGSSPPAPSVEGVPAGMEGKLRFSLAGVQLKFSMKQNSKGAITLPMKDENGDIILKTPSETRAMMPEGEFTAMSLARAIGVETADVSLVSNRIVEGIDPKYLAFGAYSLAARRFDRRADGTRVHMEDFAQAVNLIGNLKYDANQSMLARIVTRFAAGRGQAMQAITRIVSDIMIGNTDSHLKNWSFIFPDGVTAILSPAYDITPGFLWEEDTMALPFAGSADPARVDTKRFERLAKLAEIEFAVVKREVTRTVERIFDVWPTLLPNLPTPPNFADKLTKRWEGLALTAEMRPAMVPVQTVTGDAPTRP